MKVDIAKVIARKNDESIHEAEQCAAAMIEEIVRLEASKKQCDERIAELKKELSGLTVTTIEPSSVITL